MVDLTGKVAVVTGASRGIGRGIALVLAEQGATVYVTGRTVNSGDYYLPGTVVSTAAECTERGAAAGGRGIAVACDHADDAAVAELFDRVRTEAGRLDILVNNAFQLSDHRIRADVISDVIADLGNVLHPPHLQPGLAPQPLLFGARVIR